MNAEEVGNWEDEISPEDIAKATFARRKSIRRSMVTLISFPDSPLGTSSPKVLVHRRSLGAALRRNYGSPTQPRPTQSFSEPSRHEAMTLGNQKCPSTPTENRPASVVGPNQANTSQLQEVVDEIASVPAPFNVAIHKTPQREPKTTQVNACSVTVDDLCENYEREIVEWPKFIARLQREAAESLQPPLLIRQEVMENPMLKNFVDIIFPNKSTFSAQDIQRQIQRTYSSIIVSLWRIKKKLKRLKHQSAVEKRWEALKRDASWTQFIPAFSGSKLINSLPYLPESEEFS